MTWKDYLPPEAKAAAKKKKTTSSGGGSGAGGSAATTGYTYDTDAITGKDYTTDEKTRFNGLPGQPEVWYEPETGKVYMVYFPPGFTPPIPLLYHVQDEATLKAYFGDKPMGYDKKLSAAQIAKAGGVKFGTTSMIPTASGDPWQGFKERMERAAKVMPWLADPEVFGIIAAAHMEGREVAGWEFESTEWWQKHSEAERAALKKALSDPKSMAESRADNIIAIRNLYASFGIYEPPEDAISTIADKLTFGQWSQAQVRDQVLLTLGVDTGGTLDESLSQVGTLQSSNYQSTIRDLYDTWLGPAFAPDQATIDRWTNTLLRDPEAGREQLIDQLRSQRLALFPEYTNPNSTYADIAAPWRSFVSQIWGAVPDDTDAEFQRMLRMNDASLVSKEARKLGLERDYDRVKQQALGDLQRQMTQGVRGAV